MAKDGNTFGSNFDVAWKQIAAVDGETFLSFQHDYTKQAYCDVAAQRLKDQYGFDIGARSNALQNVVWSTAVQHGVSGAVTIFAKSRLNRSDADVINDVYDERGRVVSYDDIADILGSAAGVNRIADGTSWAMDLARLYGIEGMVIRLRQGRYLRG